MQKTRLQILVDDETRAFITGFCIEYRCKNESEAVRKMVMSIKQMRTVIKNLEQAAWKAANANKKPLKITKDHPDQQSIKDVKK